MIKNGEIALILNTVEEKRAAVRDSYAIRRAALQGRITLYTTIAGGRAACTGMQQSRELKAYDVQSLHARIIEAVH
jgi:carbamoyl-phosphate synthase large subunit